MRSKTWGERTWRREGVGASARAGDAKLGGPKRSLPARMRILGRYFPPVLILVAAVSLWQLLVSVERVPDYLLPGPVAIWQTSVEERDTLFANALPTLEIAGLGLVLALALGLGVALAIHFLPLVELSVLPIVIATQAVPVLAIAPLLVILFGFSLLPKLFVVALVCFFPVTINTVDGLRSVEPDILDLLRSFGANKWQRFREAEWPSALPFVLSGGKVAATYSVIGAFYGELVGSSDGLAYLINQAQAKFDTPIVFSAMLILTLFGLAFFAGFACLERLLVPWKRANPGKWRGEGKHSHV